MASPQLENGYIKYANELHDALVSTRLPGQEIRVVMAVAKKTYGFNKKKDQISYGQLSKITDIPRPRVIQHVKSLVSKKVLGSLNNGTRKPPTLWINKDYDQWEPSPKKKTSPNKETIDSPNNGTIDSPNKETHKIHIKDTITKDKIDISRKISNSPNKETTQFVINSIDFICQNMGSLSPKKTDSLIKHSIDTVDKLIRIDGFTLDYIKQVLTFGFNDDFWQRQILSLSSLRKKGKNDLTKFQNLANRYEQEKRSPSNMSAIERQNRSVVKKFLERRLGNAG